MKIRHLIYAALLILIGFILIDGARGALSQETKNLPPLKGIPADAQKLHVLMPFDGAELIIPFPNGMRPVLYKEDGIWRVGYRTGPEG